MALASVMAGGAHQVVLDVVHMVKGNHQLVELVVAFLSGSMSMRLVGFLLEKVFEESLAGQRTAGE